ncbi:hypothetical protein REPUB_Repub15cG0114000 [Reevesia pubescens]
MANMEDEGFYHSLSRKELQSLCKKYGLPANRSSSDMAKSVVSYLQNQGLGSMTSGEGLYGIQEAELPLSLKLQLQSGASLNSFGDAGKDCYGLISCPIDRRNGGNYTQAVKCNALGCCTGGKFYHKDGYGGGSIFFQQTPQSQFVTQYVTQYVDNGFKKNEFPTRCFNRNYLSLTRDGRMTDMPQIEHKETNIGAFSNETSFPSSMNTPAVSPSSFQFHVSSEEGINLYVDLNSKPSEWVDKLKSEVSICQNMSHTKFQAFHKELGRFAESSKQMKSSFQMNVDAGKIKDGLIHSGLPPSLIIKENNPPQLDNPDGDDGSLGSTVMTPCARAVYVSEHLEGDQGLTLLKAHPDSREQIISGGASSVKDGRLITLDSNINFPREKLGGDAVSNISDDPLNLLTTGHQNSKLENITCGNSTLQNGCNLVSPGGIIPGCLPNGSLPIPMPEDVFDQRNALHSPCKNGEFVDLVDPKHNIYAEQGVVGSTERDQETFRNRLPTLVEEQGRSKIINCGENSECSLDELFENCGGLDNVESNVLSKKRAYIDGDQNDCSMLDAKILRSTKHLIRKVLPRRSMRRVSKHSFLSKSSSVSSRTCDMFGTMHKSHKIFEALEKYPILYLAAIVDYVLVNMEVAKFGYGGVLGFLTVCLNVFNLFCFLSEFMKSAGRIQSIGFRSRRIYYRKANYCLYFHSSWDYVTNVQHVNTCNEIHKKLVEFNLKSMLIDQELKKLIYECSKRDDNEVLLSEMEIEQVKEDQESMKQGLLEFLMPLFQPHRFDFRNLESFVLEQEVYKLMMNIKRGDIELKFLMKKIEELISFVDERNMKVNQLKMKLDGIQKKSNLVMENLDQSGDNDQAQGSQKMCGFSRAVALDIQKFVASRQLDRQAFKNSSMFDDDLDGKKKGFDTLMIVSSKNCDPIDYRCKRH